MDITMQNFDFKNEYIFFLQHPEKKNYYLIIQQYESVMHNWLEQFNRRGKYENGPVTMPHNKVTLVETLPVPDKNLCGLCYFICHETPEITYEEDGRWPYAEMGWYVVNGDLQTAKWFYQYITKNEERKSNEKNRQTPKASQISLF